jgi:hypothetical protein
VYCINCPFTSGLEEGGSSRRRRRRRRTMTVIA